ncbi:MAG TPA: hypothetical protein VH276_03590 [Solirubrobacteraceae bacterium]|nr:hypothetical protein [Solirubrobacteraceae bacterium]
MSRTVHAGRAWAAVRALALAAVLSLAALTALALPRPALANHSQPTIFDAPRELRSDDARLRARTLDEITSLGASWVRVVVGWHGVAPNPGRKKAPHFAETDPASYDWHVYDRIVAEARARGLKILMTPSSPVPRWATLGGRSTTRFPSATRFGRFVQALGARYRTQVSNWSVWNEPNLSTFLGPQYVNGKPYSPKLYRRLYQAASGALKRSGNGSDRLLIGETAPRMRKGKAISPLSFFRGVLCLNTRYKRSRHCGKLDADGWAHHPYTTGSGPYWQPPIRDDVSIGSLRRMTTALARAGRARALKKGAGLWLTEFGVQSYPDPYVGVSQQRQAEWRSIGEWLAWKSPRVKAFSQYLMRDDLPRTSGGRYAGFESGLRRSNGTAKLALRGFRLALVADRASKRRVNLWGHVRPAKGRTRAIVQYHAHGRWHTLKSVRTDRHGVLSARTTFHSGRSYRLRWQGSTGPSTRVTQS